MARYAVDEERRTLIVSWGTGAGDRARVLAGLPEAVTGQDARRLARELTDLSAALWATYTHPPEAAEDLAPDGTRARLPEVPGVLLAPNLPASDGTLVVSYDPVEETAHRVGRTLHRFGDEALTEAVVAEVRTELDAVGRADRGDLAGRAAHAVTLTRVGASPAQIAVADAMLREDPLGGTALFTELDPAASAVAAAHWLQAAADVAACAAGLDPADVVREADNIEALPHETPTAVLDLMAEEVSPYRAVTGLISDAVRVSEGLLPDVDALLERLTFTEEVAEKFGHREPNLRERLLSEMRTTPLDPSRPAQDLLEDLLSGIYACWLIFSEDADDEGIGDDDYHDALRRRKRDAFMDAVRAEADLNSDRLS
ncbi:hypothetical protein [Spirillospora albida]|uniref:hypothetical protein n=1 Tax=Spirillospora albida TaxID=58123 RepID=UPI0004C1754E|nr:hypothetical protein [Spirillospora albida]